MTPERMRERIESSKDKFDFTIPNRCATPMTWKGQAVMVYLSDMIRIAYDLQPNEGKWKESEGYPPEQCKKEIEANKLSIDFTKPNEVCVLDDEIFITLKEAFCYAYNLKPNE